MNISLRLWALCLLFLASPAIAADPPPPVDVSLNRTFVLQIKDAANCLRVKPPEEVTLRINGIDSGLRMLGCDPATGRLTFILKRSATPESAAGTALWEHMLGNVWETAPEQFVRKLTFAVTQPGTGGPETLVAGTFGLHMLDAVSTAIGLFMIFALVIAMFYLSRGSGLIRDAGNAGTKVEHRPFSLGRTQMAWWLCIILGSYLFLWIVVGETPVLSPQALALLGIAGATGMTAAGLDASKKTGPQISSGKLFTDVLTDADGVTIYRFQMVAMTVILGVIFLIYVGQHLAMPTFDANVLTLIGISAGTYAGFKIPEKQGPPADQAIAPAPGAVAGDPKAEYRAGIVP